MRTLNLVASCYYFAAAAWGVPAWTAKAERVRGNLQRLAGGGMIEHALASQPGCRPKKELELEKQEKRPAVQPFVGPSNVGGISRPPGFAPPLSRARKAPN